MVERRVTALETPSMAALSRVLSQMMFKSIVSPSFLRQLLQEYLPHGMPLRNRFLILNLL